MKVDHIPIKELQEIFGHECTEKQLRQVLGIYNAFPERMKQLAKLIDQALKIHDEEELQKLYAKTPKKLKEYLNELFS